MTSFIRESPEETKPSVQFRSSSIVVRDVVYGAGIFQRTLSFMVMLRKWFFCLARNENVFIFF